MNKTILIIEDDKNIADLIKLYLEQEGFRVIWAGDGVKGLEYLRTIGPDFLVLDWMLPEMDGLEVLKNLRGFSNLPVLLLTAKAEEFDKVLALELGADDYLTKPFSPKELVARVKAIFRRISMDSSVEQPRAVLEVGGLRVDPEKMLVTLDGKEVAISGFEFKLLYLLASNSGQVFSRQKLLEKLYENSASVYDRTIDVHVKNLRKKLGDDAKDSKYIVSVFGVGYKFKEL